MPISTLQSGSFPSNVAIDTDTLVVDGANNRVGVGTASPAQPLHIVGGAVQFQNTQSTYLQVNTSDTHLYTAGAHPLRFGSNSAEVVRVETGGLTFTPATNNLYTVSGTLSYYGTTNNVYLNGASSGGMIMSGNGNRNQYVYLNSVSDSVKITTNTLERLGIDSSGRVTMPYQPAFLASATGNSNYTSVSSGTAFPANTAYKNIGGHYNTTTYRFTAPVDGFYLFCWSALTNNTTSQSRPTIMVNGSTSGHAGGFRPMAGNDPGALGNMFSTITYLSANDYVSAASDSGNLYFYGDRHSGFSGTLLS